MKTEQKWKVGDCLKLLPEIPDKSVDLVFFDPPYNVGKDYGVYQDTLNEVEYSDYIKWIIFECERISKNGIGLYTYGMKLKFFWDFMPKADAIIINTKAVGWKKPPHDIFQYYHAILTTSRAKKRAENLWDDIRVKGEGFFFNEHVYDHPCQTTLKGTQRFIELFSNEGDVILDPFLGCGTTLEACMNLSRNCIGFEIDPQWEPIYRKRLKLDHIKLDEFI